MLEFVENRFEPATNQYIKCTKGTTTPLTATTEELNEAILKDFYEAVNYILTKSEYDEIRELENNTINPAQQNIFIPLRTYRVLKNGHYKKISIHHRFLGGCTITEEKY